jgi:hypothetical protein
VHNTDCALSFDKDEKETPPQDHFQLDLGSLNPRSPFSNFNLQQGIVSIENSRQNAEHRQVWTVMEAGLQAISALVKDWA